MKSILIFTFLFPMLSGAILPFLRFKDRKKKLIYTGVCLILTVLFALLSIFFAPDSFVLFKMSELLQVIIKVDHLSVLFLLLFNIGFLLAGFFAFEYLKEEEEEGSFKEEMFYAFYLLTLGALNGMAISANLIAMYLFFEMVTLLSMPLVLFEKTKESIQAAFKYLYYSIGGAFLALFLIFVLADCCNSLTFVKGGTLDLLKVKEEGRLFYVALGLGIIGFGAKAGMYPLHGWLPTAHPVAPAPASAVLSGLITKAGVLAIIRILYFIVSPDILFGTTLQTVLLSLSLLTVFMGSMMAYQEKILKKRLAYSSVSQISYVLFGLFLFNETGFKGALMQIVFHATVKVCLFLFAGSVIFNTKKTNVDDLVGFGKAMPLTFLCFTFASLSLIGIPPFAGFVSKWYLASGALSSKLPVINYLGPVILLISALLTAGYLLPITIKAFFPGKDFKKSFSFSDGSPLLFIPLICLAVLSLAMGIFAGQLEVFFASVISLVF